MKYTIGDIVRIKNGLVIGEKYNGIMFTCEMNDYCGEIAKIESINPWSDGYRLDIDKQKQLWTDDMIALRKNAFRVGDSVRVLCNLVPGVEYRGWTFFKEMEPYVGKRSRIIGTTADAFILEICPQYAWSWEMLDHASPEFDYVQEDVKSSKDVGENTLPFEVRKICKLIGALRLAGVEEFTVSYSYGEVKCDAEMDVSEVEDR